MTNRKDHVRHVRAHALVLVTALTCAALLSACIQTSGNAKKNTYAYDDYSTSTKSEPVIETNHNAFRITDVNVENNGRSSKVAKGSITNNDTKSHSFVYLKVSFLDDDMDVVAVEGTYATGREGLGPGESTTWQVHTDYDSSIRSARAEVVEYD